MRKHNKIAAGTLLLGAAMAGMMLSGCGSEADGKTQIRMLQYKPEATDFF